MTRLLALPLLLVALVLSTAGMAQTTEVASPAELQHIITEAQKSGAEVLIVRTTAPAAPAAAHTETMDERAMVFRNRLAAILADAAHFPRHAMTTISGHDPNGGYTWPITAVLLTVVFLAVGAVAEYFLRRWWRERFLYLFNPTPASRAEKVSYLLVRGLMMFAGLALQIAIAVVLVFAVFGNQHHTRGTQLVVIGAVAIVRGALIFFFNLLAPDTPSHRMLHLTDDQANAFYRGLRVVFVVSAAFMSLCVWMDLLELQRSAHKLSLISGLLVTAVLLTAFFFWQRQSIASMVIGPDEEHASLFRKLIARNLHILLALYFVLAWCFATYRLVMDHPDALGLVGAPVLLTFAGIAAYGVAVLIIEWAMTRRHGQAAIVEPDNASTVSQAATMPGAAVETVDSDQVSPDAPQREKQKPSVLKPLFERAAGVVIAVLTLSGILELWGLDVTGTGFLKGLWEIILISFVAYLAYSAVNLIIDQKIAEERTDIPAAEPGEEGGRAGTSRLGTLLPITRNFLLVVIAAIAVMIGLSEMGVDIGPLFAGAGVVGIAVGFGAQTLIADIFSGAFFLIDDAFRKGEYIEIGGTRGTVEKISVRSMQLRHHRGALHTIPFSQIHQLTNYSRDWAMMKLPLRLTYDTDPEKVRKLIKKLGQELLQDPELGPQFLQPLKSQGVLQMDDSAMIFRVKYMTRPGDQFTLRKEIYSRIRELFAKEGIKFAHRQVTVRLAEAEDAPPLSPEQKEAVAGAVAPLLEEEAEQQSEQQGDDR